MPPPRPHLHPWPCACHKSFLGSRYFKSPGIKFGLCNAHLIAEPINANSQRGLSSPVVDISPAKEHDTRGDRGITCSIFRVYVHEYWQDNSVQVSLTHTHARIPTYNIVHALAHSLTHAQQQSDNNIRLQHRTHLQDGL